MIDATELKGLRSSLMGAICIDCGGWLFKDEEHKCKFVEISESFKNGIQLPERGIQPLAELEEGK